MKALGAVAILLALLVTGCGPDEDCCAPDPTPSPPSTPDPAAAAHAFVRYAEGGPPDVPWATTVRLSVRGEPVADLTPAAADRRRSWRGCPAGEPTYEGRDCPVSVLDQLRDTRPVLEQRAPEVIGCNLYTPPDDAGPTTVYLRPAAAQRSCFTDYAIAIGLDADGAVATIDLALSGP